MNKQSEKLAKAIAYEAKKKKERDEDKRPAFHVTPTTGWCNDPNGFSRFGEEYHLFYQYYPYENKWGPMHWGHCRTKDFIKWEELPCALAPDMEYDGQGCFSGTAVEHEGKHILMYTSVLEKDLEDGTHMVRQTQSIAIGDGENYEKVTENPVITADCLPEGSSPVDFRDPKIWKEDGRFYALIGSKAEDGSGQLALFTSEDALHWNYEKMIDQCKNRYGKMWECPDFFALNGCQVLIVSPQFMRAEGLEFHNGNNSIYFTGDYEKETMTYTRGDARQVDYGMDFYAPQTVETTDGRRVMIAWLQSWDNFMTPEDMDWTGLMTIPRELHVEDGSLVQLPVREIENYYTGERSYENVTLENQSAELDGITGRSFDMTVEVKKEDLEGFSILLACDDENYTELYYNRYQELFTVDRTYSGLVRDVICSRSMKVANEKETIKFRIVMDKYTIEVFANDGKQAMTTLIYTDLKSQGIVFSSDGKATFSVTQHTITMPE